MELVNEMISQLDDMKRPIIVFQDKILHEHAKRIEIIAPTVPPLHSSMLETKACGSFGNSG